MQVDNTFVARLMFLALAATGGAWALTTFLRSGRPEREAGNNPIEGAALPDIELPTLSPIRSGPNIAPTPLTSSGLRNASMGGPPWGLAFRSTLYSQQFGHDFIDVDFDPEEDQIFYYKEFERPSSDAPFVAREYEFHTSLPIRQTASSQPNEFFILAGGDGAPMTIERWRVLIPAGAWVGEPTWFRDGVVSGGRTIVQGGGSYTGPKARTELPRMRRALKYHAPEAFFNSKDMFAYPDGSHVGILADDASGARQLYIVKMDNTEVLQVVEFGEHSGIQQSMNCFAVYVSSQTGGVVAVLQDTVGEDGIGAPTDVVVCVVDDELDGVVDSVTTFPSWRAFVEFFSGTIYSMNRLWG